MNKTTEKGSTGASNEKNKTGATKVKSKRGATKSQNRRSSNVMLYFILLPLLHYNTCYDFIIYSTLIAFPNNSNTSPARALIVFLTILL